MTVIAINAQQDVKAHLQVAISLQAHTGTLNVGCMCSHWFFEPLHVMHSVGISRCGAFLVSGEVPTPGFLLLSLPNHLQPSRLCHMLQNICMSYHQDLKLSVKS